MAQVRQARVTPEPGTFVFADAKVDAAARQLLRAGKDIAIEPKAFAVLLQFLTHPGQLLSRDQLLDAVWGHSYVTPATLNRIVAQLRKALADDSERPHCIQTVHGVGYRFIAPIEHVPAESFAALRFAPPARARLPERAQALIGRERDIDAIAQRLAGNRLVTVVGPGGIGKTQAALEAARRIAARFPDDLWLLDCTPFCDADGVMRALADMFGIRGSVDSGELLTHLAELLHKRRALLVLDNCERVAAPLGRALEALLAASASLHALVTSQHRLNCAGESLYPLPPLAVPPAAEWTTDEALADLSQVPSVQLLLLRSRACASSFVLTPSNAEPVAGICRHLEGLPLALEIAAARLRLLSPEQLLLRIKDHLLNLAEASPGRPARHQTLHGLIEWSFALLSEREQSLLGGLAIFHGGCTLGGANAIGAALGLDDEQTLDLLSGLIDKSLLTVEFAGSPPRYFLLDSVRLFALERLAGDETRMRDAHMGYFVEFTERVNVGIQGDQQQSWADRVKREWFNLHAAFDHALTRPELGDRALALASNLCWYFRLGTDYGEAARWLDRALSVSRPDTRHGAQALIALGTVLHHSSVHERAGRCLRDGVALATRLGETRLAAAAQAVLAFELATCGDFDGAEANVEASLTVAEASADASLRSMALLGRAMVHALNERYGQAQTCLGEAVELVAPPGRAVFQHAYALINLALQHFYLGDRYRAARDWRRDLDLFIDLRHWRGAAGCVEGAAYLASELGEANRAARWLAAAAVVRRLTEAPLMPQWRKAQVAAVQKARDQLGGAFEDAQRLGATARFEAIVAEARVFLDEVASTQAPRTGASSASGS